MIARSYELELNKRRDDAQPHDEIMRLGVWGIPQQANLQKMTAIGIACKTHGGRPRALLAECTSGYRRALLAKYESSDVYIQRICLLFCVSQYSQRHSMNGYWRHRRLDYQKAKQTGVVNGGAAVHLDH